MAYLANTVTKVGEAARGEVLVCGSHGGLYPGYLVARSGVRAAILNDAGVGRDAAGVASLPYLDGLGIAAATVQNISCRIGDASDMMQRGVVSFANSLARQAGVEIGMRCADAAIALKQAMPRTNVAVKLMNEARSIHPASDARRIVLIDSASLIAPEDRGQIIVTGSHGGLIGGNDFVALQVDGFAGIFHDAGGGIDSAGISRLPALDRRGIAGVTVAGASARIGDARSVCEDGIISHVNGVARQHGARPGERLLEHLLRWARHA